MNASLRRLAGLACALALMGLGVLGWAGEASAQADLVWLDVGDYHYRYSSTGTEPSLTNPPIRARIKYWPGIYFREGGTHVRTRQYIGVRDFTDETGQVWPFKVARTGPRVFDLGEHLGGEIELVGKFAKPQVFVDGFQSFSRPTVLTRVDPSIKADRVVNRSSNSNVGLTWEETIYGFSNFYHDDYHIRKITWTNTGNVDEDEEIELPDQTLREVMIEFATKEHLWGPRNVTSAGVSGSIWDYVGDGKEDVGPRWQGVRAFLGWIGNGSRVSFLNRIGGPMWRDGRRNANMRTADGDSVGRLGGAYMMTRAILHVDTSPSDPSNDPAQPRHTGFTRGGEGFTNPSFGDAEQMANSYAYAHPEMKFGEYGFPGDDGHAFPHEADLQSPDEPAGPFDSESWYDRMGAQIDVDRMRSGGRVPTFAIGPYTFAPGESITMVWMESNYGLSRDVALNVGRAYKDSGWDDTFMIEYDGQSMTKNRWVLSTRDSILSLIRRAEANWASGLSIPHPPMPPSKFEVVSGSDRIVLTWDTFPNANQSSFEIWRTRNLFEGALEDDWKYQLIATPGGGDRRFEDTDVIRGISYFYYIISVGEVNNDGTAMTPTGMRLKSSRYYTQTYSPAFLKRPPGNALSEVRVVPNPYILEADKNIRFPDQQDKMAFFEIPGQCTIKIYSELGELIHTIEHGDGSGDEFWNLTTDSNQVVTSGIYFAVVQDLNTNEKIIKKFVIIR
ncbi:MAG: hypothetical protein O7G87_04005 [bacterium]|nr:hypothetical protein [bacterium]